jgi:Uma2 family endonuclease
MEAEVTKKLFTVQEYHRMARAGILREDDRLELIEGEIIEMSPIGHRHFVCVNRMNIIFSRVFGDKAFLSIQGPLCINEWTELQPDVVLFKPRPDFYAAKIPDPSDVLLVVEVSDTTLATDQKIKLPRYAAASIAEYWIADLRHDVLHVYRDVRHQKYTTALMLRPGESVALLSTPDVQFRVDELLTTDFDTSTNAP